MARSAGVQRYAGAQPVEHARAAAGGQQFGPRLGVRGQRFLADDVLAGCGRAEHDLTVVRRRQARDDEVDVGRVHERTPVRLHAPIAEAPARRDASRPLTSATDASRGRIGRSG